MRYKAILTATLILILTYSKSNAQAITDTATLRNAIKTLITTNGAQQITAAKLNRILNGTLNVMPLSAPHVDTVYQRGDSLFYKKNGIEYLGAITGGGSYEPPITAPYSPLQYFNGYKQFAPLNADSIPGGASNLYWYNTNANAGWGLNLSLGSGGTAFTFSADSLKLATLTQARRIADSAAAAVPISGKVNYTDTSTMLSPYLKAANAFNLPAQTGNSGKYLTTNGTSASWGSVSGGGSGSVDTTSLSSRINNLATKLPYYSVTDYGAIDDSLTDNTAAIQNTIDTAYAHGGGIVYFPFLTKGKYLIKGPIKTTDTYGDAVTNSQIYIPYSSYDHVSSAPTIILRSDYPPNPYSDYTAGQHENTQQVELISTLGGSNTGAVIGSAYAYSFYGNWNYTQLYMENMTIVVRSVTDIGTDTVATLGALDLSTVEMSNLLNVKVKTQSFLGTSVQPLAGTFGIYGPVNNNFNATNWTNIFVSGFDKGLILSENANVVTSNINGCDTGICLTTGFHSVNIGRSIVQWCKVNLEIKSLSIFNIEQLDMEDYGDSTYSSHTPRSWFTNVYDVYEPDSTGSVGNVHYHMNYAYGSSHDQEIKSVIYSPLISMNTMPSVVAHLPNRNYINTTALHAMVNNDHVVGLDLSKITFAGSGGLSGATFSYLKVPSNDGATVDSTALSFNTTLSSALHGTDISSGFGDVRVGSLAGLSTGSYITATGANTGHNGNLYLSTITGGGKIAMNVTGGDTALVINSTGDITTPNRIGINLGTGVLPTHNLEVGGTVQFNSLNTGGLVFSNAAGLLSNTYSGGGGLASSSSTGLVSIGNQTLGSGIKTMQEVATTSSFDLPITSSQTVGVINMNGYPIYHSYGSLTNTFVGTSTGNFSMTGSGNAGFGYHNLAALTAGNFNTTVGSSAGSYLTSSNENTMVGFGAGSNATDPSSNICIGAFSGKNIYSNSNGGGSAGYNVMIGDSAGSVITYNGSYNVLIGHYALNYPSAIPNNKLCVTGGSTGANLLYGDFNTGQLQVNASQYSPALTPSAALEVISTSRGLLPPRLTAAQRNAISSPATGLTLYCTDCIATDSSTGVMQTYNGSGWKNNW